MADSPIKWWIKITWQQLMNSLFLYHAIKRNRFAKKKSDLRAKLSSNQKCFLASQIHSWLNCESKSFVCKSKLIKNVFDLQQIYFLIAVSIVLLFNPFLACKPVLFDCIIKRKKNLHTPCTIINWMYLGFFDWLSDKHRHL